MTGTDMIGRDVLSQNTIEGSRTTSAVGHFVVKPMLRDGVYASPISSLGQIYNVPQKPQGCPSI